MSKHTRLIQWFLDLVQIDTQSILAIDEHPSNPEELIGITYIENALAHISGCEVRHYDFGTLVLILQATEGFESLPTIALAAHVDTSPSASGKVLPLIHEYIEGDVKLPNGNVIIPADSPCLTRLREIGGGHVISGDGTSLLGADDKAGAAALMELVCRLKERSIPHPRLVFLFTTDEEIGEFGGDLPAELLECIDILWTIDGTTLGTLDTSSLKMLRNKITISGDSIPSEGTRQITIEFKGKGGHPGITPELYRPAHSTACDFLYTAMELSEGCMPIYLNGNASRASLTFAADGEVDYQYLLQKVLLRHPEVTADIEEAPLEDGQLSHTALKYVAAFGKMIYERCPIQTHRGKDGNGLVVSRLIKPIEDNPDTYLIVSLVCDETPVGFKLMEDFFIEIETEIRDSLADGIVMEKDRKFICENVAYAINKQREFLEPMRQAINQSGLEPVERFVPGGTDGGMLNITYPHLPCPNIGTGAEMLHCEQEHISKEDLETLSDILTAYIVQVTDEDYKVEYTTEITNFLDSRSASNQGAFFLPYLKPGMKLLDCGCGPGSITVDLAEIVAPAEVIGIDIDENHIRLANDLSKQKQIGNVQFNTGDITKLAFPDNYFDAVFVHGVIEYLDAECAFSEIYRVLKKGGVVGSRHADYDGFLIAPESPELIEPMELFAKFLEQSGGDPHCGRNQLAVLRKVGFKNIKVSASYDCWTGSQEATHSAANMMATYCLSPELADPLIKLGITDRLKLEELSNALREWGENENAFAAEAWGEAVAWKP